MYARTHTHMHVRTHTRTQRDLYNKVFLNIFHEFYLHRDEVSPSELAASDDEQPAPTLDHVVVGPGEQHGCALPPHLRGDVVAGHSVDVVVAVVTP